MHGTSHANLGIQHAERLRRVRGTLPTEPCILDGLSHMFKAVPHGVSGQEAFGFPGDTDPRVAGAVARWVGGRSPRPADGA